MRENDIQGEQRVRSGERRKIEKIENIEEIVEKE